MPVGQGHKSWGSLMKEVTYGVDPGGARNGYFRIVPPDSLNGDKSYYNSPGSGTRINRGVHEGVYVCGGDIAPETNWEGGWLHFLRMWFGQYGFTPNSPVASVNAHAFSTVEDLTFSYAMEISRGDIPANQVFLYRGVMGNTIEFGVQQDSLLTMSAGVIARADHNETTLAQTTARVGAPTYPTDLPIKNVYYNPSYDVELAVMVGSNVTTLQGATIRGDNRLERRPNLGKYTAQPIAGDTRDITVELIADYEDTVHLDKWQAETEGTFLLTLTGPIITGSTRYDIAFLASTAHLTGGTPPIDSLGLVRIPLNAKLIKSVPEFTVIVHNAQATL